MKAIHGGKTKDDDIDAEKIGRLVRGGNIPIAYVYPKGRRETRDLLGRRNYLVRKRAELIAHIQITNAQYNLPPFGKKLIYAKNRAELKVPERFAEPQVQKSMAVDVALIDHLDEQIADVERGGVSVDPQLPDGEGVAGAAGEEAPHGGDRGGGGGEGWAGGGRCSVPRR